MRLGQKLREIREAQDLSQEELAYKAKIARRALQRLELGEGNPTIGTLEAIGQALGEKLIEMSRPMELPDILFAADFLAKFANAPPHIQRLVLAILNKDEQYLNQVSPAVRATAIKLLKGVVFP